MTLSIVTTLYKSSLYVDEFYTRISEVVKKITNDYEIIFVDDGSPDDSLQKVLSLHKNDQKLKIIELSRNFGHHKAIMTGLSYAQGDYVFFIDCDLEEEPELLGIFWSKLSNNNDLDVVYGVQTARRGGAFQRYSGELFFKCFNIMSDLKVEPNYISARLMTANYNKNLLRFQENEIFIGGLWAATGFNQVGVAVEKKSLSPTTYTLSRKLSLLVNAITSFSNKPLLFIFYIGILISLISCMCITVLMIQKIFFGIPVDGWTSLMVSVWFLGGLVLFSLGVIGIYISKIFIETKNRPYTIVRNIF